MNTTSCVCLDTDVETIVCEACKQLDRPRYNIVRPAVRQYNAPEENVLLQEKQYLEPKSSGSTYLEWLTSSHASAGHGIEVVNASTMPRRAGLWIDRRSLLGSPFIIGRDGARGEVMEKYLLWLRREYLRKGKVYEAFMALVRSEKDLTFLCWCPPLPCHGDVLRTAILQTRAALKKH